MSCATIAGSGSCGNNHRPRERMGGRREGDATTAEISEALTTNKLGDAPSPYNHQSAAYNITPQPSQITVAPVPVIELRRCIGIIVSQLAHDGPRNGKTAGPAFRERMRSYVESRLRGTAVAFAFRAARASAICASSAARSAASDACFSACAVSRSATIRDLSSANVRAAANRCADGAPTRVRLRRSSASLARAAPSRRSPRASRSPC